MKMAEEMNPTDLEIACLRMAGANVRLEGHVEASQNLMKRAIRLEKKRKGTTNSGSLHQATR